MDVADRIHVQPWASGDVVDGGAHRVDVSEDLARTVVGGRPVERTSRVGARQASTADLQPFDAGGRDCLRPQQEAGNRLVAVGGQARNVEVLDGAFDVGDDVGGQQDLASDKAVGDEGVVAAGLAVTPGDTGDVPVRSPLRADEAGHPSIIIKVAPEA